MFGMFKKKSPKYFLVEQPGTRVLILPKIFLENSLTNQVFNIDEVNKLIQIFTDRRIDFKSYRFNEDEVVFDAHILNKGEVFWADANDLRERTEEVCEFEFFAKL